MDAFGTKLIEAANFFVYVFIELAVLFILISFLVGLIQQFITPERTKKWLAARNGRGYMIGAGLGALSPFCSCSTIPIFIGLLKARAGFGPTLSFLLSSPLISPVIITLFASLIGVKLTVIYVATALGLAVVLGFVLERFGFERYVRRDMLDDPQAEGACCASAKDTPVRSASPQPVPLMMAPARPAMAGTVPGGGCCPGTQSASVELPMADAPATGPLPWPLRLRLIFLDSVKLFKSFIPYVALGVAIGGLVKGFVPAELVVSVAGPDNPLAIPSAALIGVPLYIRASTIMPVAMSFMAKGMSLGAVLALVVGSAGASLPEVILLKRVFKWPMLAAFLASVFFTAVMTGLAAELLN
jgi:uncharacterized membrane protein YraQ (UPF0718 family)